MDYKLQDLIDVDLFQTMLESLNDIYAFSTAIIDNQGNILAVTAWQDLCVKFHRVHPQSEKECRLSNQYISDHLHEANPSGIYRCPHGMVECATPIIIEGRHLANFFIGQTFLEKPDIQFFKKQALVYDFDESSYLEAVEKVPVWTREQLDIYLTAISSMIDILISIGTKKLKEIETRKTIQENEERFKILFDGAPDAIILAEPETGIIVDANYAASKLIGKPVSEIIGMHQSQLHPARIEQHTRETFRDHAVGGKEIGEIPIIENFIIRPDGTEIPVEIVASTITIDGKQVIQGVFRDITRRKQSEGILRIEHDISILLSQTNDLGQALNRLLEMVCQLDGVDCGIIYLVDQYSGNIDMLAHYGLSEQFINQNSHFIPDSENAAIINQGKPVFKTYPEIQEQNIPIIIQEKLRSTSIIPIMQNGIAIASFSLASHQYNEIPDDTRIALKSIASNLGGTILRISTENQLKESEVKYSQAFQTSPDSVNINSLDGTYIDINDGFTSLMGYSKEEIIGRSSLDLNIWVIPEDRQKLIAGLQKEGRVENLESVFRAKDGSLKTALVSASFITINNILHILSITRDISERKKFETELIAAKEKAEESDRLKSAFLSNLSHELRTPMNGILGFSELLDDDSITKEKRHEYVSIINDSGLSLLEVITNIMDISKIDSRQIETKIRTFNLNRQLDELMKWFRSEKIIKDKAHLKVELKKALPDEQSIITTDQGKIRHIFSLLLNNAAKFTSEGNIQFGYSIQQQKIRFFVKDTGKGIPADKHDAIFERFRQEEETLTRKYGGAGLGLAIAKGLVELMGGKIWVESEAGKGSTFWFEIPML